MSQVTLAFVDELLDECRSAPINDEPPQPVTELDVLLPNEASDNLKRIFTAIMKRAKQIAAIAETGQSLMRDFETKYPHMDNLHVRPSQEELKAEDEYFSALEKLKEEIDEKTKDMDLVSNLFWKQVQHEYPELRDKKQIGIYQGWRLGWKKEREFKIPGIEVITVGSIDELQNALLSAIRGKRR